MASRDRRRDYSSGKNHNPVPSRAGLTVPYTLKGYSTTTSNQETFCWTGTFTAKVSDFGLAQLVADTEDVVSKGADEGTLVG